jgi:hypothetical protein
MWRARFISTFVAQHVAWRRPAWLQLFVSVLFLIVLLEENIQRLVVDEALAGLYLALSWLGVVRLPDTLTGTLAVHAVLPAAMLAVSLGPLGLRRLAARAPRRPSNEAPTSPPAAVYRVYAGGDS